MASFIDLGFLHGLAPVLIFLFSFAILYALLGGIKILGDNKSIHAIIALVVAIFVAISIDVSTIIVSIIPWFFLIMVFLVLIILGFGAMGGGKADLLDTLGTTSSPGGILKWALIVIALIIILSAIANQFGQSQLELTNEKAKTSTTANVDSNGNKIVLGQTAIGVKNINSVGRNNGDLSTDTGDYQDNFANTMYHPRMLGFILIILIGTLTVALLTQQ